MLDFKKHRLRTICLLLALLAAVICIVVIALVATGNISQDPKTAEQSVEQGSIATSTPEISTPAQSSPETIADQQVESTLDRMSLEEKIGQMVIARAPTADPATIAAKADQYHLGGYILFAQDFANKTASEVQQNIESYQAISEIPMFIAVDEEGGIVNRASLNPNLRAEPFLSPQELYWAGGFDQIRSDTSEKAAFLKNLGVNLNFAPVADVSTDPDDFIYDRTFGQSASPTAEYIKTVVGAMKASNLGSTLKHFPGYGDSADTHEGIAYDDRPYETFANSDFLPFKAGINAGADLVLVAHNVVSSIDSSLPASLSPRAHQILRDDLEFNGLIITDDLAMSGVKDFIATSDQISASSQSSDPDAVSAILAVQAGNDLLCSTDFETQIPALIEAVQSGAISEDRIDQSVARILEAKQGLGLFDPAQ